MAKKKPIHTTGFVADDFILEEIVTPDGTPLLLHYERKSGIISPLDSYTYQDQEYVPFEHKSGIIKDGKYPENAEEYDSFLSLFNEIRAYIHRWVQMEEFSEVLATYYALFTWVYDEFDEVPYLRVLADLGSGKSRLAVQILGSIVYKPTRTIGVSSLASTYRTLDITHGTFVLDEADLDKSEKNSELVQMLNMGYMSDLSIQKLEASGKTFDLVTFSVFGPKIIVGREVMKDAALESRCITVKLAPLTRTDIPFLTDKQRHKDATELRNKLLMFRFKNQGTLFKKIDYSITDLPIQPRTKQLLLLISSIIDDPAVLAQLKEYATQLNEKTLDMRSDTFEAELLMAIIPHMTRKNLDTGKAKYFVPTQDMMETFNVGKAPFDKGYLNNIRSAGSAVKRKLNLEGDRQQVGGVQQRGIVFTWLQIANLCRSYGLEIPPVVVKEGFEVFAAATPDERDKMLPDF